MRSFKTTHDEAARKALWYAAAKGVADGPMDCYRFKLEVSRPEVLPKDVTLDSLLRKKRKDPRKLTKEDKDTLDAFGHWRSAVLEAESSDAANIKALLVMVHHIEDILEARPVVERIVRFIEDTWDARVYRPIDGLVGAERQGARIARNEQTMPTWLLNGSPMPRFVAERDGTVEDTGADVFAAAEFFDDV